MYIQKKQITNLRCQRITIATHGEKFRMKLLSSIHEGSVQNTVRPSHLQDACLWIQPTLNHNYPNDYYIHANMCRLCFLVLTP